MNSPYAETSEPVTHSTTDLFGGTYLAGLTARRGKAKTRKQAIFDNILAELNPRREKMGLDPMTHSRLGWIFKGVEAGDIEFCHARCLKANSYSAEFSERTGTKKKSPLSPTVNLQ